MSIIIPIKGDDQVIEVQKDSLPEDASEILDILKAEVAPLNVWIQFAQEYYNQDKIPQFEQILNEVTSPSMEDRYPEQTNERVMAFSILAGYYIEKAEKLGGKDEKLKGDCNQKANSLLAGASQIDNQHPAIFVGRGVIQMNQGRLDSAETQFETARSSNSNYIPALLGLACVAFNQKKYADALKHYKHILKLNPNCPASVRYAIGMCYHRMGFVDKAKIAFERVLKLDENNVPALTALAILDINSENPVKIKNAIANYLRRAVQIDPKNSMVLNHLANHFFYKGDMMKVQSLGNDAYVNTTVSEVKAESLFQRARAFHAEKNYESASKFYHQVTNLWPDFPLGRFGLAQMYYHRHDLDKAIANLEQISKNYPEDFATHKMLGSIYGEKGNAEKAMKHLSRAHEIMKGDEEVLIEMAQLENQDFGKALDYLNQAKGIMEQKEMSIPFEFWNNLGALYLKAGKLPEAEENLTKALALSGSTLEKFAPEHVSLVYNMAKFFEDSKQDQKASEIYIRIIQEHPTYMDCYLRVAVIEFGKQNLQKAIKWATLASEIKPNDPTPHAFIGYMYLMREEWSKAQQKFEFITNSIERNHLYSLISMGSVYFMSIRPNTEEMKEERIEKNVTYAANFFEKALKSDKKNIFAALSLGAIIAEKGYLEEAKDIFYRVRELSSEIPEAWLNIAHIALCQKQFSSAAKLYENVLKKFYNGKNVRVMMYLAKTYFEAQQWDECEQVLKQALDIDPMYSILWYDIGITQYEHAAKITSKEAKKKTIESAKKAISLLESAITNFEKVIEIKKDASLMQKAEIHITQTKAALTKAEAEKKAAEQLEKQAQEKREAKMKHLESEVQRQQREEQERNAKEREREEEIRRRAEENQRKLEALRETWFPPKQEEVSSSKKEKKKKGKSDDFIADNEEAEYKEGSDEEGKKKKKKGSKKKKLKSNKEKEDTDSPTTPKKKKGKKKKETPSTPEDKKDDKETEEEAQPAGTRVDPEGEAEFSFDDGGGEEDNKKRTLSEAEEKQEDEDEPAAKKQKTEDE